jgi:hypothetical protein
MAKHPRTSTGSWSGTLSHALSSLHTDVRHCSVKLVIKDDAEVQEVKQSNRNKKRDLTRSMQEGKKHGRQPTRFNVKTPSMQEGKNTDASQ